MAQSPFWRSNSCSAGQEIRRVLREREGSRTPSSPRFLNNKINAQWRSCDLYKAVKRKALVRMLHLHRASRNAVGPWSDESGHVSWWVYRHLSTRQELSRTTTPRSAFDSEFSLTRQFPGRLKIHATKTHAHICRYHPLKQDFAYIIL
jgi:hypothetical protein